MPGKLNIQDSGDNEQFYNAGFKWQDELNNSNLPGTYTTFYREYDPALGRFQAVDPKAALYLELKK